MEVTAATEKLAGLVENPVLGPRGKEAIEHSRFPYTYSADWLRHHTDADSRADASRLANTELSADYEPRMGALAYLFEQETDAFLGDILTASEETREEILRTYRALYRLAGEAYQALAAYEQRLARASSRYESYARDFRERARAMGAK